MLDLETLHAQRLARWGQTDDTRIPDADAAAALIGRLGVVTLYPVSPQVPNLLGAFVGDPDAKPAPEWDSPGGQVYGWRWSLGRADAAFYTAIVRNRPTWVAWPLLSSLLRLRGELRPPDALYLSGELSANAYRIASALGASGGVLTTGQLRRRAGFPTGKAQRSAYLKAVDELDSRLLLAKVFSLGDLDMSHALVRLRYPRIVEEAEQITIEDAFDRFLGVYFPSAVYVLPSSLAKHLKVEETDLRLALDRLVESKQARRDKVVGQKGSIYVWIGDGGTA
ncbi:MAG: hypothetical protein NVSMB52_10850 [Chloroflexota bacterium]